MIDNEDQTPRRHQTLIFTSCEPREGYLTSLAFVSPSAKYLAQKMVVRMKQVLLCVIPTTVPPSC